MIAIDEAHCALIYGLVVSAKPRDILELGLGTGRSAEAIVAALKFNLVGTHTIVDNWHDWNGRSQKEVMENRFPESNFVVSDESEFLSTCKDTYDFILSDGDHHHADQTAVSAWNILRSPGILIYHDVTNPGFKNLENLLRHFSGNRVLFSQNSRPDEECDRGLLVIFK